MKRTFILTGVLLFAIVVSFGVSRSATDGDEYIRKIQTSLSSLGFDPGPADGKMGQQTRQAIRNFEEFVGLPATGKDSDQLRDYLYVYMLPVNEVDSTVKTSEDGCGYTFYFGDDNQHIEVAKDATESCIRTVRNHLGATLKDMPLYGLITSKAGWREWDGKLKLF